MKSVKILCVFCLVSLLGFNVMAADNVAADSKLNTKITQMLSTFENESSVGGMAIMKYTIDENGVIKIVSVEATDESVTKYIYKHLDGKKIKLKDGITIGEHLLKVAFKAAI